MLREKVVNEVGTISPGLITESKQGGVVSVDENDASKKFLRQFFGRDCFEIINPPQAAILAVGAITDRVVAVDGKPGIRAMITLTLSCDHRVADGARAALFLNDLRSAILDPNKLL